MKIDSSFDGSIFIVCDRDLNHRVTYDFDEADFSHIISSDFGDKLAAFKGAYDTPNKSLLM